MQNGISRTFVLRRRKRKKAIPPLPSSLFILPVIVYCEIASGPLASLFRDIKKVGRVTLDFFSSSDSPFLKRGGGRKEARGISQAGRQPLAYSTCAHSAVVALVVVVVCGHLSTFFSFSPSLQRIRFTHGAGDLFTKQESCRRCDLFFSTLRDGGMRNGFLSLLIANKEGDLVSRLLIPRHGF